MRRHDFYLIILLSVGFLLQGCQSNHPEAFTIKQAKKLEIKAWDQLPGILDRIVGVNEEPITRILLDNITIDEAGEDNVIEFAEELVFNEVSIEGNLYQLADKE